VKPISDRILCEAKSQLSLIHFTKFSYLKLQIPIPNRLIQSHFHLVTKIKTKETPSPAYSMTWPLIQIQLKQNIYKQRNPHQNPNTATSPLFPRVQLHPLFFLFLFFNLQKNPTNNPSPLTSNYTPTANPRSRQLHLRASTRNIPKQSTSNQGPRWHPLNPSSLLCRAPSSLIPLHFWLPPPWLQYKQRSPVPLCQLSANASLRPARPLRSQLCTWVNCDLKHHHNLRQVQNSPEASAQAIQSACVNRRTPPGQASVQALVCVLLPFKVQPISSSPTSIWEPCAMVSMFIPTALQQQ